MAKDGETIDFAGRTLTFIDSPGHAYHHHCIVDSRTNSIFTGDTLGVCYRALRDGDSIFMAPTTTPVQFDPEALHQSINKIMSYDPTTLYLTHYGAVQPSAKNIAGLHEQIDDFVRMTEHCSEKDDFESRLKDQILDYLVRRCANELPTIEEKTARQWLKMDAHLNAQGLAFWWQYRRA